MSFKNPRKNGGEVNLKGRPKDDNRQDGLEMRIQMAKGTPKEVRIPGTEMNFKAKRRWEILRRTDNYRRDWDKAFANMVKMLKLYPILEAEDLGCEPTREKMREVIDKLMQDPKTWKDFLKKKFQKDWPPAKLKEEFLYSQYVTEGRELADKYGLITPYNYNDPLWDPNKDHMPLIFDMMPVKIIAQNNASYKIGPNRELIVDHTPNLRDKRWLTIEIDLYTDSLKPVWNIIKSQIDFYRPLCSPLKIKKRGPAINFYLNTERGKISIYDLWDMNKIDGKSPWEITKELYHSATYGKHYQVMEGTYDKDVRSKWMQIDTAIKTADEEINPLL